MTYETHYSLHFRSKCVWLFINSAVLQTQPAARILRFTFHRFLSSPFFSESTDLLSFFLNWQHFTQTSLFRALLQCPVHCTKVKIQTLIQTHLLQKPHISTNSFRIWELKNFLLDPCCFWYVAHVFIWLLLNMEVLTKVFPLSDIF